MHIRKLTQADEATYLALVDAFYHDGTATDHIVPAHHTRRTFRALLEGSPFVDAFLAEKDGKAVGFVLLSLTWSNEAGGLTVWVEELFVKPEYRGQGIAWKLMDTVQQNYPAANRFRLEVTRENTDAIQLYQARGFVPLPYDQMILDFPPEEEDA